MIAACRLIISPICSAAVASPPEAAPVIVPRPPIVAADLDDAALVAAIAQETGRPE